LRSSAPRRPNSRPYPKSGGDPIWRGKIGKRWRSAACGTSKKHSRILTKGELSRERLRDCFPKCRRKSLAVELLPVLTTQSLRHGLSRATSLYTREALGCSKRATASVGITLQPPPAALRLPPPPSRWRLWCSASQGFVCCKRLLLAADSRPYDKTRAALQQ